MSTGLILHVAETLKGGIASYFEEIVPVQARQFGPHNVLMLVPRPHLEDLPSRPPSRVTLYRPFRTRALNILTLALRTRSIVLHERPSVVHVHSTYAGIAVRLALIGLGNRTSVVYCAHGWAFDRPGGGLMPRIVAWFERHLAPRTDAIVCISEHDRRSAIAHGLPADRLLTLFNGVSDLPPASESDRRAAASVHWRDGALRVLYIGRFDRQKGTDVLADALSGLGPEVHAHAIGGQVLGDKHAHDWPDNVDVHAWMQRNALRPYIESCDLLVVPSRWEGFGLVAVEAMRAGKPVIATRVGGLTDIVRHDVTGWLVPPDDATALRAALVHAREVDLVAMGRRARQRYLQVFTSERLSRSLIALYERLVTERRVRGGDGDAPARAPALTRSPARPAVARHSPR